MRGKVQFLGMVRGKTDDLYVRYWNQLVKLAPEFGSPLEPPEKARPGSLIVHTEGKTDWKHLQAALSALKKVGSFAELEIEFDASEDATGDKELLRRCQSLSAAALQPVPHIHIFDRDNPTLVASVEPEGSGEFRDWGNNVYSFAIPTPKHRRETPEVCIELYYADSEIRRVDREGRRLFLSSEFHEQSFRHLELKELNCIDRNIFRGPQPKIVDDGVFDPHNANVALSKNAFADYVVSQESGFDDFDFSPFQAIFEIIQEIQELSQRPS